MPRLKIETNVTDYIATVTFSHPPVNAFSAAAFDALAAAFTEVSQRSDVRVIILAATGPVFLAGYDVGSIEEIGPNDVESGIATIARCVQAITEVPQPVIAAIQGGVIGAGVGVATAADIIMLSRSAFFSIPEIDVGIVGGAEAMKLLIPHRIVAYLGLSGDRISADEVYRHGGAHALVEHDELMSRTVELAQKLAAKSPQAARHWKQYLNKLNPQVHGDSTIRTILLKHSPEANEAARAWLEKRAPRF